MALVTAALWLAGASMLSAVGEFLVVEDPLQPAAAIVVLNGGVPFREQEAAKLYEQGWAPRVVIIQGHEAPTSRAQLLEQLGVPAAAIEVIDQHPTSTLGELDILARTIGETDAPVLLVTSPYHARRASFAWWRATDGRVHGIMRPAWQEKFDSQAWWYEPQHRMHVWHECVGLAAYIIGLRDG